ncbi:phosphatidate cytidylyltransferase 4, chloroplastic-like isoform X3 [Camellia sinensis]|uniref:phosphatidate cytidylyltransferase 4, chloroplastic-like isoform X3 n=1 Tax=Camellia sinensis TaxID=4442 RepID=UPI001036EC10|nr:phosphatidate cytidylyltransferase 4, chloroplastic-like isoform X3 [Camellia sinensis]
MASYIEISRCNLIPLSLSSLCACHSRRPSSSSSLKTLILTRPNSSNLRPSLLFDGSRRVFRVPRGISVNRPRVITAVASTEPDRLDEGETKEVDSTSELQQKAGQLKKRIVFGLGIGISCGGVVLAGGWVFTVAIAAAVFVGSREYFELVRSRGIAAGMTPPPRYVSRFCSVICTLIPILTLYFGLDVSVTSAAFVVAMTLLLQRGNPRFAQLSSTMFGLFYCGYLPSFWVKLRCGLAAPALNSRVVTGWPLLLGGQTLWTVGLVATLISISSIIAADTCAFAGGKAFGRTPLTNISPKKTWEGAAAGLAGCIATSVILSRILSWPTSFLSAIAFGVLNFFGSLFGDLTESMIKRDAGVKDSGSLIPGHVIFAGGLLDRVDSYIFTGALAYSFVKTLLPLYGV